MPLPHRTTLVIAHFEDLLSRGLRVVIDDDAALEVVAGDVDPARLGVVLQAHRPQVAILDVDALDKLARVRELSRQHPDTRLVLIAGQPTTATCAQLLAFGASACLGRDTQARDLLAAVYLASRGLQLTPRQNGEAAAPRVAGSQLLTPREAEILPLLQEGRSNAHIAGELHVGVETIRTHVRNIFRKLGVESRRELIATPVGRVPEEPEDVAARSPRRFTAPHRDTRRHPVLLRPDRSS
jgi:DNA-binding NarL/FixJ family response regulator